MMITTIAVLYKKLGFSCVRHMAYYCFMTIKVISINLWRGGILLDKIIDFLRVESPDIVFMQEVHDGAAPELEPRLRSIKILTKELGYAYSAFAPAFLDIKTGTNEGNAILSRFPLGEQQITFFREPYGERDEMDPATFPTSPRNMQQMDCQTPAGTLHLVNFHGVWDLDGDNFGERRREMRDVILKTIEGKQNIIMAADTNARTDNQAIRDIASVIPSVFKNALVTTMNVRRKDLKKFPGYATAPVDIICASPNIKVASYSCPDADISDHLPLIATFELNLL